MNKFERRIIWLFVEPWPIWVMAFVVTIHLLVIYTTPVDVILTNKIASAGMQIVGGLIVIFSIDSNLGLFRKQSLLESVLDWCNGPDSRNIVAPASFAAVGKATLNIRIAVDSRPTTTEERLAELERITAQLRTEFEAEHQASRSRIDAAKRVLYTSIAANQQSFDELSENVKAAAVDGFKPQAFGVMLTVWGAGTSVFT